MEGTVISAPQELCDLDGASGSATSLKEGVKNSGPCQRATDAIFGIDGWVMDENGIIVDSKFALDKNSPANTIAHPLTM